VQTGGPGEAGSAFAEDVTTALASGGAEVLAESIAETVGQPENEHVEYAQYLRQSIPTDLYDAAHSVEFAYLLAIALILDRNGKVIERQLSLAREQLGTERANLLRRYYDALMNTGPEFRLPLLAIAFPALKLRPRQELSYLVSLTTRMIEVDGEIDLYEYCFYRIMLTTRMIEVDGEIDLYEYCFYRIMMGNLGQAVDPSGRRKALRSRRSDLQSSTIELLRILADYGHKDDEQSRAAFITGISTLGAWAQKYDYESDLCLG
jgi:hypothetical protein